MSDTRKNISNLSRSIRPYRGEMTAAIICSLIKQIAVIGAAALTSYIVGLALTGAFSSDRYSLIVLLCVCIGARALCYFLEMYFAHDVAFRVIRNFRTDLFEKLCEISPAFILRKQTGQIGQNFVADVEILELFLAHTFSAFIVAAVMTVAIVIVLMMISPVIAVMLLIAEALLIYVPYSQRKKAAAKGAEVRSSLADGNSVMVEAVQGIREISALGYTEKYEKLIDDKMEKLYDEQYEYGRKKGAETMAMHLISGLFTVAVMVVSAVLTARGSMTPDMYPVAVMISTVVLSPVIELSTVAQELGIVFAASNRVQETLSEEPVVKDIGRADAKKGGVSVRFDDVRFGYGKRDPGTATEERSEEVLHGVSFDIGEGQKVVLVGHSGSGKSTCASLLLRYWDVDSGSVSIGGKDIREYSLDAVRKMVAAVQQDTYLFHTTVRENLCIGRPDASDEELENAARQANAYDFIMSLPDGFDTVVGERGFRLSGGQRQRIAIARAILSEAPVVILDEAVSNLDTENELYIRNTLETSLSDKTVMMIAHRLSTIASADKVIMLDHGKVAAVGTHTDLLRTSEAYRKLIGGQLIK